MANKNGRPKQPKCPECKKALYKSIVSQSVKKEWPYVYCRNEECKCHGDIREHGKKAPKQANKAKKRKDIKDTPLKGAKTSNKAPKTTPKGRSTDASKQQKERKENKPQPPEKVAPRKLCSTCGRVECICEAKKPIENEQIAQARGQIKQAIDQNRGVIGLTLAMLNQELGDHKAANRLIDEYDLTTKFGILKKGETK